MQELRANTEVIITVGPFPDVGDGFTPQIDIDITTANEAVLMKHGQTAVVDISGGGWTWAAVANLRGYYSLTLTTTDTNTEGMLLVAVQDDSDCLPVKQEYMVLSEAAYDSKYAAKDDGFMDVNVKTIGRADTQETEANNLESACSNYSVTRGLAGTALPAAAADAAGGLPVSDAGELDIDTLLAHLDADVSSRNATVPDAAGTAVGLHATTDAAIAALENLSAAEAEAACDASLATYDAPSKAELDAAIELLKRVRPHGL